MAAIVSRHHDQRSDTTTREVIMEHSTILQQELDEVEKQIVALEHATEIKPDYGLGEGDPAISRLELDKALLQQLRERADTLRRALEEMSTGAYGVCEECGRRINPDRLAILPDTKVCIECAKALA